MANRLKMVQKELLFTLFSQNWSIRKINTATGIHRKTITKYQNEWRRLQDKKLPLNGEPPSPNFAAIKGRLSPQSVPPGRNKAPTDKAAHFQVHPDPASENNSVTSKSKAAVFHDVILKKLDRRQSAKSIFQDLVTDRNYTGSYDSIKRYIKKLKNKHPKLYARIETPPGEEAQVDFGQGAPTLINGRYRRPWLFVMTLSNSRKSWQEVVWKQDVETFIRCHERAFAHFGGSVKVVKLDNLKAGVLKAHLYEPELNPNYLAFARHYNMAPIPCRVATPQHKGKVESDVNYVQSNALKGKKFESIEEQNAHLRKWDKTWASTRIHGTTKRQVNVMFEEEKPFLQPLPKEPYAFFKISDRKVSIIDSHIEVAGAYYPIPPQYMGRQVVVHFNTKWVKVYYQNKMIQFLSTVAKGRFHPDKSCLPEHKSGAQAQYIQYLFDRCSDIGPSVIKWAKLAEQERKQRAYRAIQGIVSLVKKYPDATINHACQQSIDKDVLSYHVVKELAEALRIQKNIQKEMQFSQHSDVIRSPLEYHNLLTGGESWKS
jgi:transposase